MRPATEFSLECCAAEGKTSETVGIAWLFSASETAVPKLSLIIARLVDEYNAAESVHNPLGLHRSPNKLSVLINSLFLRTVMGLKSLFNLRYLSSRKN
ncbi:MAG: hypothetical protein C4519_02675 [Desulfobacteraceae bacterium]|nr:MAG: hypothetical protein C4519_02675 [Desulfobacteraceae bacterium]